MFYEHTNIFYNTFKEFLGTENYAEDKFIENKIDL